MPSGLIEELLPALKRHADIGHNLDDDLCRDKLEAAIDMIERRLRFAIFRRFIDETLETNAGLVTPTWTPDDGNVMINHGTPGVVDRDGALQMPWFRHGGIGQSPYLYGRMGDFQAPVNVSLSYACGYEKAREIPAAVREAVFRVTLYLMEHRGESLNAQVYGADASHSAFGGDPLLASGAMGLLRPFGRIVS